MEKTRISLTTKQKTHHTDMPHWSAQLPEIKVVFA